MGPFRCLACGTVSDRATECPACGARAFALIDTDPVLRTRHRRPDSVGRRVMTEFPKPKFHVDAEDVDGATRVLSAVGEVHVSTAPLLAEQLNASVAAGHPRVVLDFSEVGFIDSTGLSVLLNALRRVNRAGGALSVVCTNPTVLRLFEITRLDETFDIVDTRDAALRHVAGVSG